MNAAGDSRSLPASIQQNLSCRAAATVLRWAASRAVRRLALASFLTCFLDLRVRNPLSALRADHKRGYSPGQYPLMPISPRCRC